MTQDGQPSSSVEHKKIQSISTKYMQTTKFTRETGRKSLLLGKKQPLWIHWIAYVGNIIAIDFKGHNATEAYVRLMTRGG